MRNPCFQTALLGFKAYMYEFEEDTIQSTTLVISSFITLELPKINVDIALSLKFHDINIAQIVKLYQKFANI